jgi:hypothetical protein
LPANLLDVGELLEDDGRRTDLDHAVQSETSDRYRSRHDGGVREDADANDVPAESHHFKLSSPRQETLA